MTIKEACREGERRLRAAGIEEAALDAWYLLEFVTGISKAVYFADGSRLMDEEQEKTYFSLIDKRKTRIPLQHLTGVQEFMGLEFRVNEHVLIPRQDTETLVEAALDYLNKKPWNQDNSENVAFQEQRILDMCTGSGCILLSLMRLAQNPETIRGIGADLSGEALKVAETNAGHLGVAADFVQTDLFEKIEGKFHMIISNPPYIRTDEIEMLETEVKNHDPRMALDGKEDGLYFYRKIVDESRRHLVKSGILLFEIGCSQGKDVSRMMKLAGFTDVAVKKDLAGLDRVVSGVYDVKGE
ncbi:MAG: peptide chain release factor N(5)-glutamine methyltransferase [Schaedlerella sp.]|nr:peptide chain release factor N(5)-glutamine methyltransferase [Lachnospiraceae bacterium]MDY4203071.1 peptide chain release factor N(5)-glutamine methyltransferase [Schaedlerella sp.]